MSEATYTFSPPSTSAPNGGSVVLNFEAAGSTMLERIPEVMPVSIPADQAYYWSAVWQETIREAMDALRQGEYEDFDSNDPNDIVRWLFSADGD